MWNDFSRYISSRKILSGSLYRIADTGKMKSFLKSSLSETKFLSDDRSLLEERWSKIYQNNQNSKFYSTIKNTIDPIVKSGVVLEYGCSIGILTSYLSNHHDVVFGIDRSFSALMHAKKTPKDNLDYVVADFLSPVFGKLNFDLIVALNILELVEPSNLLKQVSNQISSGTFVISDPYDYEKGKNSVKNPIDELTLRKNLRELGFKISLGTKNPSYIKWNLKLYPRATLNYEVDLVVGKK
ncbi:MAG: class I SAM-dependent methyltransferase [Nitrosopumilus sp.]